MATGYRMGFVGDCRTGTGHGETTQKDTVVASAAAELTFGPHVAG